MRELVLRLEPGADLRRAIEARCLEQLPQGGFVVSGIGSLRDPVLRLAGQDGETRYQGPYELLTLAGSVTRDGAHLHASLASASGAVVGGHLPYGNQVRTTAELLLAGVESVSLAREPDAATGFKELVARPR